MSKPIVRIDWPHYMIESNDPDELRLAAIEGPLKPDGSGERVPYDGFEDESGIYHLVLWPKKLHAPIPDLSMAVTNWLQAFLGKGYAWHFERKPEARERLHKTLETYKTLGLSFKDLVETLRRATHYEGLHPVEALALYTDDEHLAILTSKIKAVGAEPVWEPESPKPGKPIALMTPEELKEMGHDTDS